MKVAWDFTCVDTVADSYFHKSSLEAGRTADMAEKMITLCKSLVLELNLIRKHGLVDFKTIVVISFLCISSLKIA